MRNKKVITFIIGLFIVVLCLVFYYLDTPSRSLDTYLDLKQETASVDGNSVEQTSNTSVTAEQISDSTNTVNTEQSGNSMLSDGVITPDEYLELTEDSSLYDLSDTELVETVYSAYVEGTIDFDIGSVIGYNNNSTVVVDPTGYVTNTGGMREVHFPVYIGGELTDLEAVAYITKDGAYYDCER